MARKKRMGALTRDDISAAAARAQRSCRLLPEECRDECRAGINHLERELKEHPEMPRQRSELDGAGLKILRSVDDFCATHFKTEKQRVACMRGAKFAFDEGVRFQPGLAGKAMGHPRRIRIIRER